jgi:hypothetical protein
LTRAELGRPVGAGEARDTLKLAGRSDRLSFRSDLPSIILFVFGAARVFLNAAL